MHIETMFVVISLENASDSFHTVRFPCLWKLFVLFQTLFLSSRVKKIEYHARIRVVYLDYVIIQVESNSLLVSADRIR